MRPRLPWAMALPNLKKDPTPIIPILENLKNDPARFVRLSVANNLNDIAKDNPEIVIDLAKKWKGESKEVDWIIKHGCRTLLKQGIPEVMELFGFDSIRNNISMEDFQISSLNVKSLDKGSKVEVIIDFCRLLVMMSLMYIKDRSITTTDNRSLNEMLNGLLNNKLLLELIHKSGVSPDKKGRLLTDDDCKSLTRSIKHTAVSVKKPRGAEFAQVCAGGIYTKEIDVRTLESKIHPGLYFCGELLDVDGICGGYNLQWAWTSGYIAGEMQ